MKKFFLTLATLSFVALAGSCTKDNSKDGGKDDGKKQDVFEVAIDGNFSDWDALTTENATEKDVIATPTGIVDPTATCIQVLKATSDEEYIYVYAEIATERVFQSEKATLGDSWDGMGDATPGPFNIYLDLDANPATGCTTDHNATNDKPMITGIGVEVGIELYFFLDTKDGKAKLGWSQTTVFPDGAKNGDPYQANWWGAGFTPEGGYNHELDNLCPTPENFCTGIGSGVVKLEFALGRSYLAGLCPEGAEMSADKIVFGARMFNVDSTPWSWNTNSCVGLIPATTLKLN